MTGTACGLWSVTSDSQVVPPRPEEWAAAESRYSGPSPSPSAVTFTRFDVTASLLSPTSTASACTPAESTAAERSMPLPISPSRSDDQANVVSSSGPSSGS